MITSVPKGVRHNVSQLSKAVEEGSVGNVVFVPNFVKTTVHDSPKAIKPKPKKAPRVRSPLPPARECPKPRRKVRRSRLPPGCSSFKLEPCTTIPLENMVVQCPVPVTLPTDTILMPPPPSPKVQSQTLDTNTGDTLVQIDIDDIKFDVSDLTVFDEDIQNFLTANDNLLQDIPLGNCTISAPPTVNDKEYVFIDETSDIILSENGTKTAESKPTYDTENQTEDSGIPPGRFIPIRPKHKTTDILIQAPIFLNYLTPLVVPKMDFKGDN